MRSGVNLAAINKLSDYTFMEYFLPRRGVFFGLPCELDPVRSTYTIHSFSLFSVLKLYNIIDTLF